MAVTPRRTGLLLFILTALAYALTNYGGIRSSDEEIVFRVGESLSRGAGFSIHELEHWPGFGVARGLDGRLYGIYPPVQSITAAPVIGLSRLINATGWYRGGFKVPASLYSGRGLADTLGDRPSPDPEPHALRFLASFFNSLVGALGVLLFWSIARRFTDSDAVALGLAVVFAFGTLHWTYAGTFFTEPLAMLLVLGSFLLLLEQDPGLRLSCARMRPGVFLGSGVCAGLACSTHLTALLFVPFLLFYAWHAGSKRNENGRRSGRAPASFAAGLGLVLLLLGLFNFLRFGNPLEDGRALSAMNAVVLRGPWTKAYWAGLWGLLISAHKGLLFYCPAVLLGCAGWFHFRRRHAVLAWLTAGILLARWLFIASFESWDAGFCLGPRYLVMGIPFLLFPAAALLDRIRPREKIRYSRLAAVFVLLCILQQFWFCNGDGITYYHQLRIDLARRHIVTSDRLIYWDWKTAPAFHLLDFRKGPFPARELPLGAWGVWALGALILSGIYWILWRKWIRAAAGT